MNTELITVAELYFHLCLSRIERRFDGKARDLAEIVLCIDQPSHLLHFQVELEILCLRDPGTGATPVENGYLFVVMIENIFRMVHAVAHYSDLAFVPVIVNQRGPF